MVSAEGLPRLIGRVLLALIGFFNDRSLLHAPTAQVYRSKRGCRWLAPLSGVTSQNGKYSEFRNIPSVGGELALCLRFIEEISEY